MLILLNGCFAAKKSPRPETGETEYSFPTETLKKQTQNRQSEAVKPDIEKDLSTAPVVTDAQIASSLFPETQKAPPSKKKTTKIQRPVELGQYRGGKPSKPGDIIFNFDDASLSEVIRTFAEILKIDYIMEEKVTGTVTVHTAGGLNRDDVFPVFFQILEANGLTAVREGAFYRIIKMEDASQLSLNIHTRSDLAMVSPGERMIIQIISLEHIDVKEMAKIIQPFVSSQGTIITHDDANTMLLIDKGISVLKALNLVKVFDVDTFRQKNHRIYHLVHTDAEEIVTLLGELLEAYGKPETKNSLIPIKRLNAFIGVSSEADTLDWISDMLAQLDVPGLDSSPKIYVYKVQNGTCAELSSILSSVFSSTQAEDKSDASKKNNAKTATPDSEKDPEKWLVEKLLKEKLNSDKTQTLGSVKASEKEKTAEKSKVRQNRSSNVSESGADTLKGEIKISTDEVRNALIIQAYPSDYQIVKKILDQLDILPRQVLIEVTIADITLTDKSDLGIEWTKFAESGGLGKGKASGTIGSGGFNFTIGLTDDWQAALAFLSAQNRVNILSTPVILATDNKEASIDVADEIPVVSTTYTTVTDGDNTVTSSVEYRETGIILTVTPHINDQGFVTLEINQEVSEVGDGVTAGGEEYPSFKTRKIATEFTVSHQQTIMIGGLMTQTDSADTQGLPFLSKIPGLRWIFGQQADSLTKTELSVFLTPHVIYSMDDVKQVTREFQHRVKSSAVIDSKPENRN